ncbi:hypothetical_protein [Leishmania braziliensis MHOM/BR/75/M2904]|uniref:Hypothetical_protein n=1 Tax=Leishmania braziliensis MHOM/BR/75/M2904 TaxID=420245 RepID=A0A3P3ZJ71_LEIBR|nr:hypothetical_protein [Leishmania braziliensis MHOM/BR/75/M2904]
MATAGAITKAAAPKKNTVDYIPSKLGYDTAIPVTILEDRSDFIEKCKPYDIIDGPNPLDDSEVTVATLPRTPTALVSAASEVILSERLIERSSRRRSHSGLKAEKPHATKQEREDEEGQDRAAFIFTRPSRDRWAEERLADHRPYQLVRSSDIETYVQYVLDDVDYDWCERQKVSPESLQRGVTYLEWAYTSSLLKAARPHVTSPKTQVLPPVTLSSPDMVRRPTCRARCLRLTLVPLWQATEGVPIPDGRRARTRLVLAMSLCSYARCAPCQYMC